MPQEMRVLFWELTSRCNLQCKHCRAEAQHGEVSGELSTGEILRAAHVISEFADPLLVFTGGEPLMRPDFYYLASTCSQLFSHVTLATNGTMVDDEVAKRIASTGIRRVSISLDGARAATHDSFRGVKGSFGAALRGFAALMKTGLKLQVNVTVTQQNYQEMERLLVLAQECGADAFHVFMLVPVGCGANIGEKERLTPAQSEDLLQWLHTKSVELRERIFIKATCAPQYLRIARESALAHDDTRPQRATRGCLAGSGVCFISHTGEVQACGYLPVSAGNIRQQRLEDIWEHSPLFTALRDTTNIKGKCGQCTYRDTCQGCRARAYAVSGDYLAEEPDCPYQPTATMQGVTG